MIPLPEATYAGLECVFDTHTLTLSLYLSLSLSHTHTQTHTHSHSLSHTHTHTHSDGRRAFAPGRHGCENHIGTGPPPAKPSVVLVDLGYWVWKSWEPWHELTIASHITHTNSSRFIALQLLCACYNCSSDFYDNYGMRAMILVMFLII